MSTNKRRVVIMSGVSGAGKSTYAKKLVMEAWAGGLTAGIVSADYYFTDKQTNEYRFDASKLGLAHAECFKQFIEAINDPFLEKVRSSNVVVVDNTNTTAEEIAPYMLGAQAFGYEAEVITLSIHPSRGAERSVHGISLEQAYKQASRLYNRRLPPFWKNTVIETY